MTDLPELTGDTIQVNVRGMNVSIRFCPNGIIPLKRGQNLPVPAFDADIYVVMKAGGRVSVLTREQLDGSIGIALLQTHQIVWQVPDGA